MVRPRPKHFPYRIPVSNQASLNSRFFMFFLSNENKFPSDPPPQSKGLEMLGSFVQTLSPVEANVSRRTPGR